MLFNRPKLLMPNNVKQSNNMFSKTKIIVKLIVYIFYSRIFKNLRLTTNLLSGWYLNCHNFFFLNIFQLILNFKKTSNFHIYFYKIFLLCHLNLNTNLIKCYHHMPIRHPSYKVNMVRQNDKFDQVHQIC